MKEAARLKLNIVFLLCFEMFCSFTQKYPPVKFLSEKDRKRILVSWYLLRGFGKINVLWIVNTLVGLTKDISRNKVNYLGCHMCCTGFRVMLHLLWYSQTQHIYSRLGHWFGGLTCQFKLLFSACSVSGIHCQRVFVSAPRWPKLVETGKCFKHILTESLCDRVKQNLVIRLEK